ncbi:hatching enzyme 1.2-like [Spea bombifrons]|uniref:hatching enzyme 1.2-like n=1 Tax=Spea bombifrons TaxID=233779 RepID=UPI0023498764|nr:hatching enzyme 1.2-like [Spea bombifrons]
MELTKILVLLTVGCSISLALPLGDGHDKWSETNDGKDDGHKTIFEQIEDRNKGIPKPLIGGDIAFQVSRSAINCEDCLWTISQDGTVYIPYVISSKYSNSETSLIMSALEEFEVMSCIKFVSRNSERDYLSIEPASGCWSSIGRTGGKQMVSLDKVGCVSYGTAQHEIMHSLGFYHEHTRSDRDEYIDVIWENIIKGAEENFWKEDTNNLNLPYDYNSVMHYHSSAFSSPRGRKTLIPKPDPNVPLGQRVGMSSLDVMKLNTLYKCNLCRSKFMSPSGSFRADSSSLKQLDDGCLWLIQIPKNKVYLQLRDIKIPKSPGCDGSYIKIYDGASKKAQVLLHKTCGDVVLPPIISSGTKMLVEFVRKNRVVSKGFIADYNTVEYGGTFVTDNGELLSPGYPDNYPNNVDALWTIIAPVGSKTLEIKDLYCVVMCKADPTNSSHL